MAIDKNSLSMLDPTKAGQNFGISNDFSYKSGGNFATNRQEVVRSVGNADNINALVAKVSYAGANQAQLPDFGVGGVSLGRPLTSDGRAN